MIEALDIRRMLAELSRVYRPLYLQSLKGVVDLYTNLGRNDMVEKYKSELERMLVEPVLE